MPSGMDEVQAERVSRGFEPDPRLNYTDEDGNRRYYRVKTNLYGLQSAGRVWYEYARAWLLDLGFTATTADPCVFHKRDADDPSKLMLIGLYVDDLLVCTSTPEQKRWFKAEFKAKFDQSPDPGDDSFLSISYRREGDDVLINTPKLWNTLERALEPFKLPAAPGAPLPADALHVLAEEPSDDNPIVTPEECDVRSILGTAMWGVLAVRPGEAFAAAAIARHVHRPTRNVVDTLLSFCSYLLHHRGDELKIRPGPTNMPVAFVDSSWANDPTTQRSWYGFCIMWAGCPFVFRSKLEPCVTVSSRDAEALGACFAIKAMLSVLIMMSELGFHNESPHILQLDSTGANITPMELHIDNQPLVSNAHTARLHRDNRHQALRLAWIREMVSNSLIDVRKIATKSNASDIFTKPLTPVEHRRLREVLMGDKPLSSIDFPQEEHNT